MFRIAMSLVLVVSALVSTADARISSYKLKKLKSYTLVDVIAVSETVEINNKKIVVMDDGTAYSVDGLFLDPLPLTDVAVFGKTVGGANVYKLLIDDEVLDATPVRIK